MNTSFNLWEVVTAWVAGHALLNPFIPPTHRTHRTKTKSPRVFICWFRQVVCQWLKLQTGVMVFPCTPFWLAHQTLFLLHDKDVPSLSFAFLLTTGQRNYAAVPIDQYYTLARPFHLQSKVSLLILLPICTVLIRNGIILTYFYYFLLMSRKRNIKKTLWCNYRQLLCCSGKSCTFPYLITQMGSSCTSNMYVLQDALLLGGYLQQKTQKFSVKTVTAHGRDCKKSRKRIAFLKAVTSAELHFMGEGLDAAMPCWAQPGTELCCVFFLGYTVKKATQTVCWECKGFVLHCYHTSTLELATIS